MCASWKNFLISHFFCPFRNLCSSKLSNDWKRKKYYCSFPIIDTIAWERQVTQFYTQWILIERGHHSRPPNLLLAFLSSTPNNDAQIQYESWSSFSPHLPYFKSKRNVPIAIVLEEIFLLNKTIKKIAQKFELSFGWRLDLNPGPVDHEPDTLPMSYWIHLLNLKKRIRFVPMQFIILV